MLRNRLLDSLDWSKQPGIFQSYELPDASN